MKIILLAMKCAAVRSGEAELNSREEQRELSSASVESTYKSAHLF